MTQLGHVMNKISKETLKQRKWYVLLAAASFAGILITIIIRIITPGEVVIPENEFIQTNSDGGQTKFSEISFSGEIPTLKDRLPLVSLQPSNTSSEYLRDRFIENHDLRPVEGVNRLWKGDNYTLSYNEYDSTYIFYKNFLGRDSIITQKDKAIQAAGEYVGEVFSQLPLYPQVDKVLKFSGLQQMEEVSIGTYTALEVPFTYAIEEIPLFIGHEEQAPLRVLINSDFEVQKIIFQTNFFYPIPREEVVKIISLGDALENINTNQFGSIISAYEEETGVFSLDEIENGDLTSVQLEYRADLNSDIAYPFYRFEGELINDEGKTIQAQIITPAVKVQE